MTMRCARPKPRLRVPMGGSTESHRITNQSAKGKGAVGHSGTEWTQSGLKLRPDGTRGRI
ncbi:protein of unknown function [Pararobbsia alpina]